MKATFWCSTVYCNIWKCLFTCAFVFAAAIIEALQTENTVGVVTTVIITLILLTISVTIIVVVALLWIRTSQPTRTPAQYVGICARMIYQGYYHLSVLFCAGSPWGQWIYQPVPMRPMRRRSKEEPGRERKDSEVSADEEAIYESIAWDHELCAP